MGLSPLEFTDGLTDSPHFRETLQAHERELDHTNTAIKHLIKVIKDLIAAARNLSRAQRTLSDTLNNFNFECIGNSQTDDEMVIANSFKDFARLLSAIEDERDRLLEKADEAFLEPIERFRREQIGSAKEAKKKFEKETAKYCQNLERYLNLSTKKSETQLVEADASNSMEKQHFFKAMSEYVLKLQEVNERKKFEFVETILSFMLGWLTFYHQGHEIATDFHSVKMELQMRLQRTRNNFNMTQEETKSLRQKMLDNQEKFKQKFQDSCSINKTVSRQGYLFLMEKKAFTTSWIKHFCKYDKNTRRLTMIQYTQTMGKILSNDVIVVKECIKRNQDTIDRRFCFDILTNPEEKLNPNSGQNSTNGTSKNSPNSFSPDVPYVVYTFQALCEEDYLFWLETLEARSSYPSNCIQSKSTKPSKSHDAAKGYSLADSSYPNSHDSYILDGEGYWFIKKCIQSIESGGLDQKGIYRVVGVTSRVRTLMEKFVQSKSNTSVSNDEISGTSDVDDANLDEVDLLPNFEIDSEEFETKTVTSALKNYLRFLTEPIMTFKLHKAFISAAKLESRTKRIDKIHQLVHKLPSLNFRVLKTLIEHLQKVAKLHDKNLMTSSNLGVCFGPTLLRTSEESVAAILDIKFVNVIAELLIENYEKLFLTKPTVTEEHTLINPVQRAMHTFKFNNYVAANQIQQRPLPNVPIQVQTATNQYGKINQNIVCNIPSPQSLNDSHGNLRIPFNNNFRRSNSQDQLYTVIQPSRTVVGRPNFSSPNNGAIPAVVLQHAQHSKHSQYPSMNNYCTHLLYQSPTSSISGQQPASSRPALHLSLSSSSPSPSLGSTTLSTMANQQQPNMIHVYPSPASMVNKLIPPNSIYGQTLRTSNQFLQPSMSHQNLYNNSEMTAFSNNHLVGQASKNQTNPIYNRPMTSIGIIPPNSAYATFPFHQQDNSTEKQLQASESAAKINYSVPANSNQTVTYLAASSSANNVSVSLPTTPEHQSNQFPYKLTGSSGGVLSPSIPISSAPNYIKQSALSPHLRSNQIAQDNESSDRIDEIYSKQQEQQQQNQIYASIGGSRTPVLMVSNQQSTSLSQTPPQPQSFYPLPSTKVRTRYICIGNSEAELSFNPNTIITDVRPTREPGWLQGNLNGKSGLIPLNYVEFIE